MHSLIWNIAAENPLPSDWPQLARGREVVGMVVEGGEKCKAGRPCPCWLLRGALKTSHICCTLGNVQVHNTAEMLCQEKQQPLHYLCSAQIMELNTFWRIFLQSKNDEGT